MLMPAVNLPSQSQTRKNNFNTGQPWAVNILANFRRYSNGASEFIKGLQEISGSQKLEVINLMTQTFQNEQKKYNNFVLQIYLGTIVELYIIQCSMLEMFDFFNF
jgi:hypothetical protein